jgi:hypothetical protein
MSDTDPSTGLEDKIIKTFTFKIQRHETLQRTTKNALEHTIGALQRLKDMPNRAFILTPCEEKERIITLQGKELPDPLAPVTESLRLPRTEARSPGDTHVTLDAKSKETGVLGGRNLSEDSDKGLATPDREDRVGGKGGLPSRGEDTHILNWETHQRSKFL